MLKLIKVFIKSLTHKKISYSYGGVDLLILDIFKNQKKGYYLDIGCAHPIKNNNTYLLYKKGWNGVNIDLDKENIDLFISESKENKINIKKWGPNLIFIQSELKPLSLDWRFWFSNNNFVSSKYSFFHPESSPIVDLIISVFICSTF